MYVRADVRVSNIVREMTAHYWGRIRYRVNVRLKARLVHYDCEGEHDGVARIPYLSAEKLKAMWGVNIQ
jgi:hypothetical protein